MVYSGCLGVQGDPGPRGDDGINGLMGEKGNLGNPGPDGPTGSDYTKTKEPNSFRQQKKKFEDQCCDQKTTPP